MSRIAIVDHTSGNADQKALLDAIRAQLGMVPGLLGVLANSPVALKAFLGLQGVAGAGSLSPQTRARIALALAQSNASEYCLAANAASGQRAGLTGNEMASNRDGTSEDARAAVAVKLARSLSEHLGGITGAELVEARAAGYTDADLVEIIIHVGLNLLTCILDRASGIAPDSPVVALHRT
jgi:AhpD family alkylhydroperoxidase